MVDFLLNMQAVALGKRGLCPKRGLWGKGDFVLLMQAVSLGTLGKSWPNG